MTAPLSTRARHTAGPAHYSPWHHAVATPYPDRRSETMLRRPDVDEVMEYGRVLGFDLTPLEARMIQARMMDTIAALEAFDEMRVEEWRPPLLHAHLVEGLERGDGVHHARLDHTRLQRGQIEAQDTAVLHHLVDVGTPQHGLAPPIGIGRCDRMMPWNIVGRARGEARPRGRSPRAALRPAGSAGQHRGTLGAHPGRRRGAGPPHPRLRDRPGSQ